ncbi:MAG TPA: hypothetical protein VES97_04335 [Solirubrobacteraceae bacterium]|nr:hypothetical protein [Solirubrobacteraceae bacterium]
MKVDAETVAQTIRTQLKSLGVVLHKRDGNGDCYEIGPEAVERVVQNVARNVAQLYALAADNNADDQP